MQASKREFWWALAAMVAITALYLGVVAAAGRVPAAKSLFGHAIGIVGFILMLMTEVLYSLRKRSRRGSWGRMSTWLQFHIFTGLVGPYMVLLHSSWRFNGLAGVVTLFTGLIVISGIIGRYIFTSIPRTADGAALEADEIRGQMAALESALKDHLEQLPGLNLTPAASSPGVGDGLAIALQNPQGRAQWKEAKKRMAPEARRQAAQFEKMEQRRRTLERQANSMASARRALSLWHAVHIPLGMVLFTAAFIHVFAALYYATLLR